LFLRTALAKSGAALPEGDALRKSISDFDGKIDSVRKKIVATTEGGAITGEERLREHTDQLYGAILSYEGKPGDYQLRYIDTLKRELADVTKEFEQLLTSELPALNESLKGKNQQPIPMPPAKVVVSEGTPALSGAMNPSADAEASGASILPTNFRLLH
jgi:hypothetical protein